MANIIDKLSDYIYKNKDKLSRADLSLMYDIEEIINFHEVPAPVITNRIDEYSYGETNHCPNCYSPLEMVYMGAIGEYKLPNYCSICGKCIDWREE